MRNDPIKSTPPGVEPGGGEDERRAAKYHLIPVYTTLEENTTPPNRVDEVIDWHGQAFQSLRRAYKSYQLGHYKDAKAALFEFYFADERNSSGFTLMEYNR